MDTSLAFFSGSLFGSIPSGITEQLLRAAGVIPDDWERTDEDDGEAGGILWAEYANGAQIIAMPDRIEVRSTLDPDAGPIDVANVAGVLHRFASLLPKAECQRAVMVIGLAVRVSDPVDYMARRFATDLVREVCGEAPRSLKAGFVVPTEAGIARAEFHVSSFRLDADADAEAEQIIAANLTYAKRLADTDGGTATVSAAGFFESAEVRLDAAIQLVERINALNETGVGGT